MALFGRSKPETAPAAAPLPSLVTPPPAAGPRSVDEQREQLLAGVTSLRPFGIGLLDAVGLTLCESIESDIDLPVCTTAKVDGWAVRGSNLVGASPHHPVRVPVVGEIDMIGFRAAPLMPGTVVKVTAGAPVPEGADAVVPLAEATEFEDEVEFTAEAVFQQKLVLAGSRLSDGDALLASGTVLDARAIGLLAEVGIDKVLARPKPRVVVASVGADLVDPGLPLERLHQVYDAGTPLLVAAARGDGAQVFPIGILPAEPAALRRMLSDQLLRADLILLVAEVTPGLSDVLGELGTVDETPIAMHPAGPGLFALVGDDKVPVLVLPREGAAAYIGYQVFGQPLIRKLVGLDAERPRVSAPVTRELTVDPAATNYLLGRATERGIEPVSGDEPTLIDLAGADTLIVVGPGVAEVPAHHDVTAWPLQG